MNFYFFFQVKSFFVYGYRWVLECRVFSPFRKVPKRSNISANRLSVYNWCMPNQKSQKPNLKKSINASKSKRSQTFSPGL
jgi:hypothetical protein